MHHGSLCWIEKRTKSILIFYVDTALCSIVVSDFYFNRTFIKLKIPEDFLVISFLDTCSSLSNTWSRLVLAENPMPIAQPWNDNKKKNKSKLCFRT